MSYSDLMNSSNIDKIKNYDTVLSKLTECRENIKTKETLIQENENLKSQYEFVSALENEITELRNSIKNKDVAMERSNQESIKLKTDLNELNINYNK